MNGMVTKKHFWAILKNFGIRKAVRVLFSRNVTALAILMA